MRHTMDTGRHGSELCASEARRQGLLVCPGYAYVDRVGSRRSTVMSALSRVIGIIHGYQSDSSSKQPAGSIGSGPRKMSAFAEEEEEEGEAHVVTKEYA